MHIMSCLNLSVKRKHSAIGNPHHWIGGSLPGKEDKRIDEEELMKGNIYEENRTKTDVTPSTPTLTIILTHINGSIGRLHHDCMIIFHVINSILSIFSWRNFHLELFHRSMSSSSSSNLDYYVNNHWCLSYESQRSRTKQAISLT